MSPLPSFHLYHQVHAQASVLQLHVSQLESVVNAWNHMQDTMIPEERAIVDALIIRARLSLEQCSQVLLGSGCCSWPSFVLSV